MSTTLGERLKLAMNGPPKVTGKALAAACGVKPPSVSDWLNGETRTMEASNLIAASEFLKVRPKWLADGVGHMRDDGQKHNAKEPEIAYLPPKKTDKLSSRLLELFDQLDTPSKKELISMIEFYVAGRRPHRDGNASAVAGKK